jgi:anti-sigma factor RsiW
MKTDLSREHLQLYFDGELTGAEAHELAAQIEADPELTAELRQLGILRELVTEGLMRKAAEVPQARFEQLWEEIDRAIDRQERESAGQARHASIWTRVFAALRPLRVPLLATAAAAAVTLVVVNTMGEEDAENKPTETPSIAHKQEGKSASTAPAEPPSKIAKSVPAQSEADPPALAFPEPKPSEADIHRVDFGGHQGRISQTGTVTVLFVEEDEQPKDSERSL